MASAGAPAISVIMSVFNGEKYVARALLSILAQTCQDFEVIVVDDGSTDSTVEIINAIADRRISLLTQENRGLTKSLNWALSKARGKWIARHDADDFSICSRFESQLLYLRSHHCVQLLGSSCFIQPEKHGVVNEVYDYPVSNDEILAVFARYNPFVHGSTMIDAELLRACGGYNESYRYVQDYELWSRLLPRTKAHNLPTPLYVRTVHPVASEMTVNKHGIFNEIRDKYLASCDWPAPTGAAATREIRSISNYPVITLSGGWNRSLADTYFRMCLVGKRHKLPWLGMRALSLFYYPWKPVRLYESI